MDRSSKDVGLDNVDAADGENKVDLGDMYIGGGDTNDGIGVDNADSKFDCGDVRDGGDGDVKIMVVLMRMVILTLLLLMMLTVVVAGAKLIHVIKHLICGNNWNWFLNLNLI